MGSVVDASFRLLHRFYLHMLTGFRSHLYRHWQASLSYPHLRYESTFSGKRKSCASTRSDLSIFAIHSFIDSCINQLKCSQPFIIRVANKARNGPSIRPNSSCQVVFQFGTSSPFAVQTSTLRPGILHIMHPLVSGISGPITNLRFCCRPPTAIRNHIITNTLIS